MNILATPLMVVLATTAFSSVAFGATKDLTLKKFSEIKVYAPVDLDITVGKKQSFTMEGGDEDLAKIVVEVRGDTLIIKKKKHSGRINKVNISLGVKNLTKFIINGSSGAKIRNVDSKTFELGINGSGDVVFDGRSDELEVEINGSGDIVSQRFDAANVSAEISGSGNIDLAGKCQNLEVTISGSGDFSGRELTCATVKARISGSGDAIVHASETIRVSTSGSSDVEVYGNPKSIRSRSSGSSELMVHDDQ